MFFRFQFGCVFGFITIALVRYFVYGHLPHPAIYGAIIGCTASGIAGYLIGRLPEIEDESKYVIMQIFVLNMIIALTGFFFRKQNDWGGINVFGHTLSGVRGSYDYLPALSRTERANFTDIAISNFAVSVVGALAVSLCVYLLNRYLIAYYKIADAKSYPQLMAAVVFLVLICFSVYGAYRFLERHTPLGLNPLYYILIR